MTLPRFVLWQAGEAGQVSVKPQGDFLALLLHGCQ
jgi:hypothetical protein